MLAMMSPLTALRFDGPLVDILDALDAVPSMREGPILDAQADKYVVTIVAPGCAGSDLAIEVSEGRLSVKGETKTSVRRVLNYSIGLPMDADIEHVTAGAADGILEVTVPKKVAVEPARIEVTVENGDTEMTDDETESNLYTLNLVAPGVAATDLKLSAEDGVLTVRGSTERTGASVARQFRLPRDADADLAKAMHVDGILTVKIPKKPAVKPMRIAVHALAKQDQALAAMHEAEEEGAVMV